MKHQKEILENLDLFLSRGYSITECLNLLTYRYHLDDYIEALEQGELFSEILREKKFDNDILLVVEIAENSGNLKTGINKAKLIVEQKIANKNQILELIKYPLLLFIILGIALGFVSLFLIPQFQIIYDSFGIELTLGIRIMFFIINVIPIIFFIILIIMLIIMVKYLKLSPGEKLQYILKNKYLKKYYLSIYNQIFSINLVNLLNMGLRLDEILIILKDQDHNLLLKTESVRILELLKEGKLFYETLQNDYYSPDMITIVKEGEFSSTLVHNLENYSIYLQQNQHKNTQKIIFLIQPIFYLIFGFFIIILYASIFVPMFQMMETI